MPSSFSGLKADNLLPFSMLKLDNGCCLVGLGGELLVLGNSEIT